MIDHALKRALPYVSMSGPIDTGVAALRMTQGAATVARRITRPTVAVLAEAPAASGLEPVPGDQGAPSVGHTLDFVSDLLGWARGRYTRFGEISWCGAFGTKVVFVLGPDGIGEVLANGDRAFSNEEGWSYLIGRFFNRGLMLMDFEEHLEHRRLMQQAFKRERLVEYLEDMIPCISAGLDDWEGGERFLLYPAAKQLTLDIATRTFMGGTLGPEAARVNAAFIDTVHGGGAVIRADVPGGRWHRGINGRRYLEEHFLRQIRSKRAGDGRDLFSVLCHAVSETGESFSDDDVVNHMIFLMMAAHDTSTSTLAMMAYFLGRHTDWQDRLRDESLALGKDAVSYPELDQLAGMDLVMKEALRMYPPVAILMRRAIKDTSLLGRFVPEGTYVCLGLYPSHRISRWWANPDGFDPERFSEERREDLSHKYAWVPFGGNVHKCIGLHFGGMEVKAVMHQLLRRYRWSVAPDYEPPIAYATGPMPADGLPVRLVRTRRAARNPMLTAAPPSVTKESSSAPA